MQALFSQVPNSNALAYYTSAGIKLGYIDPRLNGACGTDLQTTDEPAAWPHGEEDKGAAPVIL